LIFEILYSVKDLDHGVWRLSAEVVPFGGIQAASTVKHLYLGVCPPDAAQDTTFDIPALDKIDLVVENYVH
jgi:hypothetical protein